MVFQAIVSFPDAFRGRTGIYFIDNVAALMALVKGRSDNAELDVIAQSVHLLLFTLSATLWYEWIPSKSNWTDSISRDGFHDKWHRIHGFRVHSSSVPLYLWKLNVATRVRIFSFL